MRLWGCSQEIHVLSQELSSFVSMAAGCLKEGCIFGIFLQNYVKSLFFEMLSVTLTFPSTCVLLLHCLPVQSVLEAGDPAFSF